MSVTEQMMEAQDRMLTDIETAQERMIEMNQRMAEVVTTMMPGGEMFRMPGFEDMPSASEMIDRYFDFATKMAEANRTFYKELVSAWAPADEVDRAEATTKAKKDKSAA